VPASPDRARRTARHDSGLRHLVAVLVRVVPELAERVLFRRRAGRQQLAGPRAPAEPPTFRLYLQATAEVTGGSVDNLKLIDSKQSEVALVMVDAALDALKGEDKFKGNKVDVRTLMVLYPNRMHVVTIEGTGIEKMADLKGKRVSTGSPGSATEVMAFRVIEAAGLDKDKDMKRERLGVAESVNALKDRKIDAFFWVGGLPTAAVTDLGATPNVKIKMIDIAHLVPVMAKKHGNIYIKDVIPQRMYKGMDADNQAATVTNLLDSGAGSLRQGILGTPGGGTREAPAGCWAITVSGVSFDGAVLACPSTNPRPTRIA